MTYEEAYEHVWQAEQSEAECKAEFGMGAVSLGYDGGEAMMHYDGYRTADDSEYLKARKLLRDRHEVVRVILCNRPKIIYADDLPF